MEKNKKGLSNGPGPGHGKVMFVIVMLCFLLIITQIIINIVNEFLFSA